jgi:hypothetical protein
MSHERERIVYLWRWIFIVIVFLLNLQPIKVSEQAPQEALPINSFLAPSRWLQMCSVNYLTFQIACIQTYNSVNLDCIFSTVIESTELIKPAAGRRDKYDLVLATTSPGSQMHYKKYTFPAYFWWSMFLPLSGIPPASSASLCASWVGAGSFTGPVQLG